MRARIEQHLKKLPPILEIDEDGLPMAEMNLYEGRRWSSDEGEPSVQMDDFPADLDD